MQLPTPPVCTVTWVVELTVVEPLLQLSWKVIGPSDPGALKLWEPLAGRVPKLLQMVPLPCAGVQDVVLLDDQFNVMVAPGVTVELVGKKLLITGPAAWAQLA